MRPTRRGVDRPSVPSQQPGRTLAVITTDGAEPIQYPRLAGAGKTKAENCVQCHGGTGKDDPAIAGMEAAKFIKAMKDCQSGERKNKKMMKAATGLSDSDLANLAAFYATLK